MLNDVIHAANANPCVNSFEQLAEAAFAVNPLPGPLLGSTPWRTSTAYAAKTIVCSNGGIYAATGAGGTSGATAPSGAGTVSDGTVSWEYLGPQQAPALSFSQTHNAALTNTYQLQSNISAPNTGVVRFGGGTPVLQPGEANAVPCWNSSPASGGNLSATQNSSYSRATYGFQGTLAEIQCGYNFASGVQAAIKVDGQYLDTNFNSTASGNWFLTLDFTGLGRGLHIIEVETSQVYGLIQLATEPTGTFFYPQLPQDWGVIGIGDSQMASTGNINATAWMNMFVRLGMRLGWPDVMPSGVGGTGFVATSSGTQPNYQQRVMSELNRYAAWRNVGALLLQMSSNDIGQSGLQQAITNVLTTIRSNWQFALTPIYVIGPITGGLITVANGLAMETLAQAAILQLQSQNMPGLTFIPFAGAIFGTGYQGATNGSGTSDFNIGLDGIHMTEQGHDFWSQYVAMAIRASLRNSLS